MSIKNFSAVITLLLILNVHSAFANLAMSKNRLVFDSKQRSEALQLRNTGSVPMTYSTQMRLVEMDEHGNIKKVDNTDNSAIKLIRFSPKRGTLQPGGKQVIRFSVRRPSHLKDGEYRAVFSMKSSPDLRAAGSVSLKPTMSYNFPIIVRHGDVHAQTSLQRPRLVNINNTPHVEFWQTLDGNRSLYGNFIIRDNKDQEVGILNGVAVYTSVSERRIRIPLNIDDSASKINIEYQEVAKYGGNLKSNIDFTL
ncbi:fimbrial biogenesis chaperone [Agaribacter marinus]|uniref:Pili assembly chaperone N-terminal domain-containing protein n=1 Tax=Agaribacter marinus TaxID=1431249 RepID=A0AA37T0D2_9ALTE|nr:fimbria/pilus periplasmic chaperone [Agaribacter marinus]GLR71291.1 hypothetical protein GCM10007852_21990 [Agaribacter marinus]